MARFSYYRKLNARQRAIYRQSDRAAGIRLTDLEQLWASLPLLVRELRDGNRGKLQQHCQQLVSELSKQLRVRAPMVRVLAKRPVTDDIELHGLYEREEGSRPLIRIWMKTASQKRPVATKTFIRTLIHEMCHHLDYELLGLDDSFHTEGFFRRESQLFRQLVSKDINTPGESKQLRLFRAS